MKCKLHFANSKWKLNLLFKSHLEMQEGGGLRVTNPIHKISLGYSCIS